MVIGDSNTIRHSAEIFLDQSGCKIILAKDGLDAMAIIIEFNPDIIFIDIVMPYLDGYKTCMLIKKNQQFQSVPIVLLTSKGDIFDQAHGRTVGLSNCLTKPYTKKFTEHCSQMHCKARVKVAE